MWCRTNWEQMIDEEPVKGLDPAAAKSYRNFQRRQLRRFLSREKKVNSRRCNWDMLPGENLGLVEKIPGLKEIIDEEFEKYNIAPMDTNVYPMIFPKGHRNLYRMGEMMFYAGGDLVSLAETELRNQMEIELKRIKMQAPRNFDEIRQEYDAIVHNFFNRLQTSVDNLYKFMAADHDLHFDDRNGKKEMFIGVQERNPELMKYVMSRLMRSSRMKDIHYLRNTQQHNVSEMEYSLDDGMLVSFENRGGIIRNEELFGLLYRFYKHVADTLCGTVDIMVKAKYS